MDAPKAPGLPAGSYVNFLRVAIAPSEVHLAFGQIAPGQAQAAQLLSTLVTTPLHAKQMLRALTSTIERYEEQFGEIPLIEPQPGEAKPSDAGPTAAGPARRARGDAPRRAAKG